MWCDLGTGETGTGIETDTVTTSGSVDLDPTSVWLEVGSRVFGGNTALNSRTALLDSLLAETEVGERLTAQPANLSPCGNEKKAMLGEIEYGCQG